MTEPQALAVLELCGVSKVYRQGTAEVHALAAVENVARPSGELGGIQPGADLVRLRAAELVVDDTGLL